MILKRRVRHVLVRISEGLDIGSDRNWNDLRSGLLQFMGERTYAEARPKIIKVMGPDTFIMSCNRGYEGSLILALSFIKSIGAVRVGFYTLKTSGTVKSLTGAKRARVKQE